MATEPDQVNLYKPADRVEEASFTGTSVVDDPISTKLVRRTAYRAWLWPIGGLLMWFGGGYLYPHLKFWLFDVAGVAEVSQTAIMKGFGIASGLLWGMGCLKQISVAGKLRKVSGIGWHLLAGLCASAICLGVGVNAMLPVEETIINYGDMRRGPVDFEPPIDGEPFFDGEPTAGGEPSTGASPSPSVEPAQP